MVLMDEITALLSLIIFPLAVLFSIRPYQPERKQTELFGKDQTTILKGILISMVFFHHFYLAVPARYTGYIYSPIGVMSVSGFFLISGYVSYLEFEKMPLDKYWNFWKKKIIRLYLPLAIFTISYNNFLGGLLWLYLITWLSYKFLPKKFRLSGIIIGNVLFIPFCIFMGLGIYWYDRVLAYSIGYLFATYKKELEAFFQRKRYMEFGFCSSAVLCGALYIIYMKNMDCIPVPFIFGLVTAIFITFALHIFTFRSKFFQFLGKLSWEIFMIHQTIFDFVQQYTNNPILVMMISIVLTIFISEVGNILWTKGTSITILN